MTRPRKTGRRSTAQRVDSAWKLISEAQEKTRLPKSEKGWDYDTLRKAGLGMTEANDVGVAVQFMLDQFGRIPWSQK
jgi:hypothetical protein